MAVDNVFCFSNMMIGLFHQTATDIWGETEKSKQNIVADKLAQLAKSAQTFVLLGVPPCVEQLIGHD
jgi:hypothetical protein